MEPIETVAVGLELRLVPTDEDGRQAPLLGGSAQDNRFTYRPNWGLPGWAEGEQTAAPVLGFSRSDIRPGDTVRAVAVSLFPAELPAWRDVVVGDELRIYEALESADTARSPGWRSVLVHADRGAGSVRPLARGMTGVNCRVAVATIGHISL